MALRTTNKLADKIRFAAGKSDLASLRAALSVCVTWLVECAVLDRTVVTMEMERVAKILGVELPEVR